MLPALSTQRAQAVLLRKNAFIFPLWNHRSAPGPSPGRSAAVPPCRRGAAGESRAVRGPSGGGRRRRRRGEGERRRRRRAARPLPPRCPPAPGLGAAAAPLPSAAGGGERRREDVRGAGGGGEGLPFPGRAAREQCRERNPGRGARRRPGAGSCLPVRGGRGLEALSGAPGRVPSARCSPPALPSPMAETKIIYHIDEEETPYLVKLPVPPEKVTLADFKNVLSNRPVHSYKFFFKSMDQDFG